MNEKPLRWLTDENLPVPIALWLQQRGHDVVRVEGGLLSAPDDVLLAQAHLADRLLLTNDRDFGKLVLQQRLATRGVLYLRMPSLSYKQQLARLHSIWPDLVAQLPGAFTLVSAHRIRVIRLPE